jgi:hypothetical protein
MKAFRAGPVLRDAPLHCASQHEAGIVFSLLHPASYALVRVASKRIGSGLALPSLIQSTMARLSRPQKPSIFVFLDEFGEEPREDGAHAAKIQCAVRRFNRIPARPG